MSKKGLAISEKDALTIIGRAVDKAIGTLKQKVASSLDRKIDDVLREFTINLRDRIQSEYESIDGNRSNLDFLLMPNGTRMFRTMGGMGALVIEQPPTVRTLNVWDCISSPSQTGLPAFSPRPYALPYCVFTFSLYERQRNDDRGVPQVVLRPTANKTLMAWSKKPLRNLDDKIILPILTNVDDDCSICMGETRLDTDLDIVRYTEAFLKTFWESEFTSDYPSAYHQAQRDDPHHFQTLNKWSDATRRDASFIISDKCKLRDSKYTVGQHIKTALSPTNDCRLQGSKDMLRSIVGRIVREESWSLTQTVRDHLDTLDISAMHKGKEEARVVQQFMASFVDKATSELREMYETQMQETLDKVERRQEELAVKILNSTGQPVERITESGDTKLSIPVVGGTDLSNPW